MESSIDYLKKFIKTNIPFILGFITLFFLTKVLEISNSIIDLIIKILLVSIVYFGFVCATLRNEPNFRFFRDLVKKIFSKISKK